MITILNHWKVSVTFVTNWTSVGMPRGVGGQALSVDLQHWLISTSSSSDPGLPRRTRPRRSGEALANYCARAEGPSDRQGWGGAAPFRPRQHGEARPAGPGEPTPQHSPRAAVMLTTPSRPAPPRRARTPPPSNSLAWRPLVYRRYCSLALLALIQHRPLGPGGPARPARPAPALAVSH